MKASANVLKALLRTKVKLPYLLYLPEGRRGGAKRKSPLLLFLHGAGERGNDLEQVKVHGPPKLIEKEGREFPFIVVAPQCPADDWWKPEPLVALLDDLMGRHAVDPERVYVTGLSMGGYGTWALAGTCPERLAAVVPICGPFAWLRFKQLGRLPVWCFHGAMDEAVPVSESIRMVRFLRAAGGNARFTVYPDAGHDAWTETYANAELYAWLLKQRRDRR